MRLIIGGEPDARNWWDKIVKHRTKVFTGQLIQLAKVYGEKKVIKYQKEEEEVCQNTIETL